MRDLYSNYLLELRLSKNVVRIQRTLDDCYSIFFLNSENRKFCIFDFYVYERSEKLSVKNGNFDATYNRLIMQVLPSTLYFAITDNYLFNQDEVSNHKSSF